MPARVRSILLARIGRGRSSEARIARVLRMSSRTLQRKLAADGTSYRELLSATLRLRAELELADPDLSIAEIASRLGFSDPANFSRAFRNWTGQSPLDFRRSRAGKQRWRSG